MTKIVLDKVLTFFIFFREKFSHIGHSTKSSHINFILKLITYFNTKRTSVNERMSQTVIIMDYEFTHNLQKYKNNFHL